MPSRTRCNTVDEGPLLRIADLMFVVREYLVGRWVWFRSSPGGTVLQQAHSVCVATKQGGMRHEA